MVLKLDWFGRRRRHPERVSEEEDEVPAIIPSLFAMPDAFATFELFTLRSSSGLTIYANAAGRLVTCRSHPNGTAAQIIVFRVKAQPGTLFLMTIDPVIDAIGIDHDGLHARVLSYTIAEVEQIDRVALRHPGHGQFVAAAPSDAGAETALGCNRAEPAFWELLELLPLAGRLGQPFSNIVEGISRALDDSASADALVDWLRDAAADIIADAGDAVLRIASPAMLGRVGIAAATTPSLLARLASIFPDDGWITDALPGLAAWLPARVIPKRLSIGTDLDHLPAVCIEHKAASSIGSRMITQARRHVEARRSLAVLATARNEGLYFLEFVAHYRALGAEHIFIYSNNNNDGSDELLGALADAGAITWIDNVFVPQVNGQSKAYSHYLSYMPHGLDFEWTLVVDLDEFLVLDTDRYPSLPHLLHERRAAGANAVAMSWMMFTPGGRVTWDAAPLIARFDQREPHDNEHVKSAFVTRDAVSSYPHDPVFTPGATVTYVGAAGAPHWWPERELPPSVGSPDYANAWINHYFFKSAEEYLWKASRNRGGYFIRESLQVDPERLAPVAGWIEMESVRDDRARRHLPAIETALGTLRALPGVADAEAKVVATFRARVGQLQRETAARLSDVADDVAWKSSVSRMLMRIAADAGDTASTISAIGTGPGARDDDDSRRVP